ncbi:hypothetical protein HK099_007771 [Clydaea vesicula]|uniref:Uncharacterized protein n=1 Tax=Clydaea vesicula TaxID=447962 RepID=A0AAD5TZI6_9FUNG|nr:hypothetical protein HK099_007771 [Clydaea vesicula]
MEKTKTEYLRPSPNEEKEVKLKQFQQARLTRLLQVRKQQAQIQNKKIAKYQNLLSASWNQTVKDLEDIWVVNKLERLEKLKDVAEQNESLIGLSHSEAYQIEIIEKPKIQNEKNLKKRKETEFEKKRIKTSAKILREEKYLERRKGESRNENRERIKNLELERSIKVVQNLKKNKKHYLDTVAIDNLNLQSVNLNRLTKNKLALKYKYNRDSNIESLDFDANCLHRGFPGVAVKIVKTETEKNCDLVKRNIASKNAIIQSHLNSVKLKNEELKKIENSKSAFWRYKNAVGVIEKEKSKKEMLKELDQLNKDDLKRKQENSTINSLFYRRNETLDDVEKIFRNRFIVQDVPVNLKTPKLTKSNSKGGGYTFVHDNSAENYRFGTESSDGSIKIIRT